MTAPERPWEKPVEPKSKKPLWVLWAVILVAFTGCTYALYGGGSSTQGGAGGAELACKSKVRAQAGQSADFTDMNSYYGNADEWHVSGKADGIAFTCTLTHISGENYSGPATLY